MPVRGCQSDVRPPEVRHVDLLPELKHNAILLLPKIVKQWSKPVPTGMMWIYAARLFRHRTTTIPVAGKCGKHSQVTESESIHRIQLKSSLCFAVEGLQFTTEELHRSQRMVGEVIRWLGLNRVSRRIEGAPQRIRPQVETVIVFFAENDSQHRPGQAVARRLLDGPFKCLARRRMT